MIINRRDDIKWGEVSGTYMYGTTVTYHSDQHVSILNPLVTSGVVLRSWSSNVNFQAYRVQASLPLLKRNQDYQFSISMDCKPVDGVYIKVSFFNRYGDIVEEKIEKTTEFNFSYPEDTYYYQISLLSAGFESMDFYSFSIKEIHCV